MDRQRDEQTRQFNPFLIQPALVGSAPSFVELELQAIKDARRELPVLFHQGVLDAILGRGLERTCVTLLDGGALEKQSGSRKKNPSRRANDCCGGDSFCDVCDLVYCLDCIGCCSPDSCGDCGCGCDSCCDCS